VIEKQLKHVDAKAVPDEDELTLSVKLSFFGVAQLYDLPATMVIIYTEVIGLSL